VRTAGEQLAWETHADGLAPRLLRILAQQTATPGLAYVSSPTRLAGGHWAGLYAFELAQIPGELVLRLMPTSDEQCRLEAAAQAGVRAAGFPAPRVLFSGDRHAGLGFPFIVMERLPAHPRALDVVRLPGLLAATLARLHALDPSALGATVGTLDSVLADLAERATPLAGAGFREALAWLRARRPAEQRRAICHGDFHPLNLLLCEGRVSGVLDWTQALVAEPEYDVAYTSLLLSLWPLRLRALPRAVAKVLLGAPAARRFVAAYRARAAVDAQRLAWYEALHTCRMLVRIARARAGITLPPLGPRHPWELVAQDALRAFARRTRLSIELPPPCAIPQAS